MASGIAVVRRGWGEGWRAQVGWSAGLLAVMALYLPLFPSLSGDGQLGDIVASMPPELTSALGYQDIASGPGYVQATVVGLLGFLLTTIAVVGLGATLLGGAEESGRLELDLAHGVGRRAYGTATATLLVVRVVLLALVITVGLLALNTSSGLGLSASGVAAAAVALAGLVLLSGAAALLAGAWSGRRVWGHGAGAGVAVAGYSLNAAAGQSPSLDWVRFASPYSWAFHAPPLTDANLLGIAACWLVAAGLVVAAIVVLERRDVVG